MRGFLRFGFLFWLAVLILSAPAAHAQLQSNQATVDLQAVLNPRLAVAVSPSIVNFAGVPGSVVQGDSSLTIDTAWNFRRNYSGGLANVSLWAYFQSPAAALTNGAGSNIPAARVRGSVNGGAFAPFTTAGPFSVASLRIFQQNVRTNGPGPLRRGNRIDTLDLEIDTSGLGLPAGVYTGVLFIQARAI